MFYSMWRLEITIAHISLPHTHPSIVPWVHNPLEARGDRGVCMLCDPIYSGQISSAAVLGALRWQRPCCPLVLLKCSCGWGGACSTWDASDLCLWLRYIASLCTVAIRGLILHWQKLYAAKKQQKNSAPIPPIPASILLVTQHSTDSPEAAENWFLHPVLADNGCPHQELDHLDVYWWFGCRMMGFS